MRSRLASGRDGERQVTVAGRAIDAAACHEPAARPELVGGAASRARAPEEHEPPVLTGPLHRHHDARDREGRHQEEVGHRDEHAHQREPPEHPEPAEHPPEAGAGRLLDDGRGRRTRVVTERGELRAVVLLLRLRGDEGRTRRLTVSKSTVPAFTDEAGQWRPRLPFSRALRGRRI